MDAPTLTPDVLATKPDPAPSPDSVRPLPRQRRPRRLYRQLPRRGRPAAQIVRTPALIASMIAAAKDASDLIFSPGRAPQVDMHGGLIQLKIPGVGVLTPEDTARIAADLIGRNSIALAKAERTGLLRHFLQPSESFAIPRQRFHPARHLRHRDARDSQFNS